MKKKTHSKQLLRIEKPYFSEKIPSKDDSKEVVISRLFVKNEKPAFEKLPQSSRFINFIFLKKI